MERMQEAFERAVAGVDGFIKDGLARVDVNASERAVHCASLAVVGTFAVFTITKTTSWLLSAKLRPAAPKSETVAVIGGGIAGTAAAWSLSNAGYKVDLFEREPSIGGNARTFSWKLHDGRVCETPILVVAWPSEYYHNYHALLANCGVGKEPTPIRYFVKGPAGMFAQEPITAYHQTLLGDFKRWGRCVKFISFVNTLFNGRLPSKSLYAFSYFNPLNLIPLYAMMRLFGVSRRFWDEIFVPVHCSTFLSTKLKTIPAVIAPLMEDVVHLGKTSSMDTWKGPGPAGDPRAVFKHMTQRFADRVHTNCKVSSVVREGKTVVITAEDGTVHVADRVVFACDSETILQLLRNPTWLERRILSQVKYVDHDDKTFSQYVVHSDKSLFPKEEVESVRKYNCYTEIFEDGSLENTFILTALPCAQRAGVTDKDDLLVTFNPRPGLQNVQAHGYLPRPNHCLTTCNLLLMSMMRFIQGRNRTHFCSTYTTPEGGHDLSFVSGLVVAREIGASYPFPHDPLAKADFHRMQKLMLGRTYPQ